MSARTDLKAPRKQVPSSVATLVHFHMGMPVTDSLTISQEFASRHDNVLQKLDGLISDGTISRLDFKEATYADEQCKQRRMVELTERGALIAMPFIGGRNSRAGQVRLVDAFMTLRANLAEDGGDWAESRQKVSAGYALMCDTVQEVRADDGKSTSAHHYANEAKLVNWVLFGRFEAINRDHMAQVDLVMMDKVEAKNAVWIARGRTYAERKAALPAFLAALRTRRIRGAQ